MSLPGRSTSELSNYFAFGVQSAKDVEATTFYFTKHLNGTGYDSENETSQERIGGSGKEVGLVYKTAIKADGSIVTYAWPDGFARLLTAAFGQDAVTGIPASGASTLTRHLITPTTGATLPYLTVDQNWADETERVTNCLVSDLKIEGEAGKPVKLTAQFISGGTPYVRGSAIAPVVRESGPPLMVPGASALWTVEGGPSGGSENTSSQITKWSLEIKNTLDDAIRTLSLFREDVVWNMVDFNADVTVKYVDRTSWNEVHYGGGTQVPVAVPTGAFSFYSSQQPGSLSAYLSMPQLFVGNSKVNRLDPDGKTMYLDFTAYGVAGATYNVFAQIVTNATASYTLSTT